MKKSLLLIAAFCGLSFFARAQESTNPFNGGFSQGRLLLSAGVGTGNLLNVISNQLVTGNRLHYTKTPLLFFKGEYAINKNFGVGLNYAQAGFDLNYRRPTDSFFEAQTNNKIPVEMAVKYHTWSVLARANYHFLPEKQFDVYIGMGIGYRHNSFTVSDNDPGKNWNISLPAIPSMGLDATVGVRAYIIPALAVYGEFGMAKGIVQGGLTLSL